MKHLDKYLLHYNICLDHQFYNHCEILYLDIKGERI